MQGKKVTRLKAGTAYRFVISDRSSIHNFHLSGPGLNRVLTGVGFTGTKSFLLKLKKGTYRFVCDPHSGLDARRLPGLLSLRRPRAGAPAPPPIITRARASATLPQPEKTGGSPRCERASAVSTIAKTNQIHEPPAAHSKGDVHR